MHKGKVLDAFKVWKRIRGVDTSESREEFYVMAVAVRQESSTVTEAAENRRFPWMDFFTYVHPFAFYPEWRLTQTTLQRPSRPTCSRLRKYHDSPRSAHGCQRHHVLHVRVDEPDRIRSRKGQLHVLGWWWCLVDWYHSRCLPHGDLWKTILGHHDVAWLLLRLGSHRHWLPNQYQDAHHGR